MQSFTHILIKFATKYFNYGSTGFCIFKKKKMLTYYIINGSKVVKIPQLQNNLKIKKHYYSLFRNSKSRTQIAPN